MAKVRSVGSAEIRVYANDHLPPHFHIVTPDGEVLIAIVDLAIYRGEIAGRTMRNALSWAVANLSTIKAEWNRLHPKYPVK